MNLAVALPSFGQSNTFQWAVKTGGSNSFSPALAFDAMGNLCVSGNFEDSVDLDPSAATFQLYSEGGNDIFFQKLDQNGNFVWASSIGSPGYDRLVGMKTDRSGGVISFGTFEEQIDVDPGTDTFNLTPVSNDADVFVQRLDASGAFSWAIAYGGLDSDQPNDLRIDWEGNIIVVGACVGIVDFDPSPSSYQLGQGLGDFSFVQKLDSTGQLLWAKAFDHDTTLVFASVSSDALGNIYITGNFSGTWEPNLGTTLVSQGRQDVFAMKLDPQGDFIWALSFGGINDDYSAGSATTPTGRTYIAGFFGDSVDFDPGIGSYVLNSIGQFDVFVSHLDSAGDLIAAGSIGSPLSDLAFGISAGPNGNAHVVGNFQESVDLNPGPGVSMASSIGRRDAFYVKLDQGLNLLWGETIGSANDDLMVSVATGKSGEIGTGGIYEGTVDLDPGIGVFQLTGAGFQDRIIQKFQQPLVSAPLPTSNEAVKVFPNPTDGLVYIEHGIHTNLSAKVYDLSGKIVFESSEIGFPVQEIDLQGCKGLLILELNGKGIKQFYRLLVN